MEKDIIESVIRDMRSEKRFICEEMPDRRTIVGIISDVQSFMFQ